ncbi:MopE-related protein [Polyangium spumosum]|uniref:Disintegrin domain-containing protein n=1 Tax=Polyangium spumosum TaxID=889282 RepID=A0A6N7PZB6_9BACT|nr:MopE-related protein [Polyangium spumosum]MRG95830.1 hypothetical protein [Polyangium spumosum]
MMSKKRFNHWAIVLLGGGLVASCTNILGIDTSYDPNPCADLSIDPQDCGQGACHVFLDKDERCLNGLPTECVEGTPNDQEVCKDGIDNNCDGNVDEGCPCDAGQTQECYNGSTDESKFGVCMKRGTQICEAGAWSECDSQVLPAAEECGDGQDNDCDGKVDENCPCTPGEPSKPCYGGPEGTEGVGVCRSGTQKCQASGTWGDCDGDVVPGTESWNGADDDCDGKTDDGYLCAKGTKQACYDGPGGVDSDEITPIGGVTPECKAGEQECIEGQWGPCLGQVKPKDEFCDGKDNDCNHVVDDGSFQVAELCNNKDDNCNGLVDEGNPGGGEVCNTGKPGPCKDGVTACVSGGVECQQNIQATTELCNGVDDDCNGAIDDGDPEGGTPCNAPDAVGACANGKTKCQTGKLTCVPAAPSTELCNGVDDNCDNIIDNGNPGSGQPCQVPGQLGVCAGGVTNCEGGGIQCTQVVTPTTEICDSKDNDCNGATDENVQGTGTPCTVAGLQGECAKGATACQNGVVICAQTKQPIAEICDGFDNDCNGSVDEGDPGGGATCTVQGQVGVCGIGVIKCTSGALSCAQTKFPSPELCDGQDNDCDTQVDEGNPGGNVPCNTGKPGSCAAGVFECISGSAICTQTTTPQPEACDGIDNDCDGQTDEGNPGGGGSCTVPGLSGECAKGVLACQNGVLACTQVNQAQLEICDGLDNNCNAQIDENNPGGGVSCNTGQPGICAPGTTACTDGSIKCNQNQQPSSELCDGQDNDCDGQTDENNPGGNQDCTTGLPGICAAGKTNCSSGSIVCNPNLQPAPETCDGLDNNCNGTVDEGNPGSGVACSTGQPGVCATGTTACANGSIQCNPNIQPSPETCDGLDNNCNGTADEGDPGSGVACSTGQPGVCATGTTACTNGSIKCNPNIQPSLESCDGLDNNCNGTSDEGNPGGGAGCDTGQLGICKAGTTACSNGSILCNQNLQPSTEVCDGLDNNCNGAVDDGNPGGGLSCVTGQPGVCSAGTTACSGGTPVCNPNVQSSPEICDGLDNDCDGSIDEGNPGGGLSCVTGQPGVCSAGTTACSGGMPVCNPNVQSSPEICDGLDNDCDGSIDENNPGGGLACGTGQPGVCADGTNACVNGALVCNQNTAASPEVCDGFDNDCDGNVDEDNPGGGLACPTGQLGVCADGTSVCANGAIVCNQNVQSSTETCDGLDNNCDGNVDEGNPGSGLACDTGTPGVCADGTTTCANGATVCNQNVQASAETCDSLDNNCDGNIDEGDPGGGLACPTGELGVCADGTTICTGGSVLCNPITSASVETCDGLDNNCDGQTDEDNPGGGLACPTGQQGVCADGTTICTNGAIVCDQNVQASAEACDGLDNNCDGNVDEGNPGGGEACDTGAEGVCADGTLACESGGIVCKQDVQSEAEDMSPCDSLDNNCDGFVDNGPFCCPSDTIQNGDESDVNCGGTCTVKCADAGMDCTTSAQCGSSTCGANNKCVAQSCGGGDDCVSGVCVDGACQPATCTDMVKNGSETDINCGGPTCGKCADNKVCSVPSDCMSGVCSGNVCLPPTCNDNVQNDDETDVDCGGSCPTDCVNGLACAGNGDCTSDACDRGLCVPASCTDGTQNGTETGEDCGGADCQLCPTVVLLSTSGTSAPYTLQRSVFNGSTWSSATLASAAVQGTPSIAITTTRHAIGVVRGDADNLRFTRWNGAANTWSTLADLPSGVGANGAPVVSASGPFAGLVFRFQGPGAGRYHFVQHVGTPSSSTWLTPYQWTGAPTSATIHDLDWVALDAQGNAALVFPEQSSSDVFFQLRGSNGAWATAATTGNVTANMTIQPNVIRLSGGDLLMTFVNSANQIAFSRYSGTWSAPAIVRDEAGNDKANTNLRPGLAPLPNNGAVLVYRNTSDSSRLYSVIYDGTNGWNTSASKVAGVNITLTAPPVVVPGIGSQDAEMLLIEGGSLKHTRMSSGTWSTPANVAGILSNVQAVTAASFQ